jgi:hypothetical protein
MTSPDPFPAPEPGLDAVVRAQLDAEAQRTDARGLADRVLARLASDSAEPASPRRTWPRGAVWTGAAALAAGVLVAVFVVFGSREAVASPVEVVQAARASSAHADVRCYRVTLDLPPRARESFPLLALDAETPRNLCTSGKQFVVEPGFGGKGTWGRDQTGRVWAAPTREAAVAFDEAELPPALRTTVKILELELTSLLDEVLADFDLTWTEVPARAADTYSITAMRRGEVLPFRIASAELVVEKKSKVVRSLVLHRKALGDGTATITFTLVRGSRPEAAFAPEPHLDPGAPVYDRTQPVLRRRLVVQQLREMANGL